MYPISAAVKAQFASGAMQYARITIGTTVLDNSKILQGGLTINRYCTTGDTLEFGSCVAAEMTLVLNNYSGEFDDIDWKGEEAYVEIGVEYPVGSSTINYIPMGYFIFDSISWAKHSVTLTALDRLILFEKGVTGLTFPMTLSALLSACCTACGVTLASGTLTNASYVVNGLPEEAVTYRDLLKWIFEIAGCCGYINRAGALAFAWYSNTTLFSIYDSDRNVGTVDKTVHVIGGVEIIEGENRYYRSWLANSRLVRISNNPLLKTGQQDVADTLAMKTLGIGYAPFSASILPSPHLFILDGGTWGDPYTVPYTNIVITEITYRLNGYTEIAGGGGKNQYASNYGISKAIPDNAITTPKLFAGAVTADKISIADLYALGATIGGWEITQNAMRKITTVGQYDYQIILYAPTSPQLTTSAVAIQRRATGTSDAWASVTRMTFAGKLISNDAEITGTINSGNGSIGGWDISTDAISKSNNGQYCAMRSNTQYDTAIEAGEENGNYCAMGFDGGFHSYDSGRDATGSVFGGRFHGEKLYDNDYKQKSYTLMSEDDENYLLLEDIEYDQLHEPEDMTRDAIAKIGTGDTTAELRLEKVQGTAQGEDGGVYASASDSDFRVVVHEGNGNSMYSYEHTIATPYGYSVKSGNSVKSELTKTSLKVNGVSYSTPTSGSGTRNTTNTTGGICDYWKIGKVVVVSFRQLVPAVTTADAILFTGLPNAVADTSFPAIATTARGAGRLYVDTSGRIKIGGNMNTAGTYLGNFTYVSA